MRKITTLGEVATYINGRAFKPSEWETSGIPIIRIQNLNDPTAKYNYSNTKYEDKYLVKKGDLLFSWSASLGAHIWKNSDAWLNQHIFRIIPNENICKGYLYHFLCKVTAELYAKSHGTGMVHITKKPFMATPIPVPSLPEQERIVTRIEELFSELDKAVETLQTTKQQLAVYRQAVLKEAFEGCTLVKANDVCKHITDGDHMPPPKAKKGIPFIMISNIKGNTICWDNTNYVNQDYYNAIGEKRTPKKGDVLYTVTGSYGIPVKVDFDRNFCFQRHIALLRPNEKIIQNYLFYALQSPDVYLQATNRATGTAQKTIGLSVLRDIDIPFFESIKHQKKVTDLIESRLSVCESIEQTVDTALAQADAMRQSILKQAFEGGFNQ